MSVTIHLEDDLDVSRGDMLCRPNNQPTVGQDLDAMVCWMSDRPLLTRGRYAIKHNLGVRIEYRPILITKR